MNFPIDDTIWGTAATSGATTWFHIDDSGFATIVKIMAGSKYWVTSRRKRNATKPGGSGDMGSVKAFGGTEWIPHGSATRFWDHEGVLLKAGDTL